MTTHTDILDTRCCCVRQFPPPEVYLMENLIMLGVFVTIHLATFYLRFDALCIASLLGVYYGIYQVLLVYSSINKRYLDCYNSMEDDEDEEDDETNDKPEQVCSRANGGCGNSDATWCCPCLEDEDGKLFQPDGDDYSDMPPLISLSDDKVTRQLQEVVNQTNQRNAYRAHLSSVYQSNERTVEQIKDSLNQLQTMITNVTSIDEFKSLNEAKED